MGSTTSIPVKSRGPSHSNYAAKRASSAAATSAATTGPSSDKQQHQQHQHHSNGGASSQLLSRSKSCSNANVGKASTAAAAKAATAATAASVASSATEEAAAAAATNGGLAYHKVSNGNYAPDPAADADAADAAIATATDSDDDDVIIDSAQQQQQQDDDEQQQQEFPPPSGGLAGLSNLGNTCYLNSILQCLSHTRPLLAYALLAQPPAPAGGGGNGSVGSLGRAYAALMQRLWDPNRRGGAGPVSPSELKQCVAQYAPRFRGYSQQDSEEFLRYLLEGLHEALNVVVGRPKLPPIDYDKLDLLSDAERAEELWQRYLQLDNSIIVDAFVGQLKSTLECGTCHHKSVTFDPFWDLALPIPGKSRTTLEACLKLFTAPETLDGNERPTCDQCRCRRRSVKRFSLYRLPSVLVIHLMRFSGERFKTKLNTLVEYPLELDVREFLDKKCQLPQTPRYQLYAVSEHSGTPYGGHYTAVVRHAATGRWLRYNDSRVEDAPEKSIVSPEGYVLFYSAAAADDTAATPASSSLDS